MAAQSLVLRSYASPVETYEVNVMGTVHMLESVRHLDHRCDVVLVTTDKVYENAERAHRFQEDDPLGGADPYSSSKAACELVARAYRESFFRPDRFPEHQKAIATVRSGNVIGGGDWSDNRLIPDIVKALRHNRPVVVRHPESVRPWQFVLEPLLGYLQLGAKMAGQPERFSEAFNFGPSGDEMLTVRDLVEKAIRCWGSGSMETDTLPQPHEAGYLQLSNEKAQTLIGWKSLLTAEQAIDMTMAVYRSPDPGSTMRAQIREYLARL
jgi:CDP-glucose 4,6-dehydratase